MLQTSKSVYKATSVEKQIIDVQVYEWIIKQCKQNLLFICVRFIIKILQTLVR